MRIIDLASVCHQDSLSPLFCLHLLDIVKDMQNAISYLIFIIVLKKLGPPPVAQCLIQFWKVQWFPNVYNLQPLGQDRTDPNIKNAITDNCNTIVHKYTQPEITVSHSINKGMICPVSFS